MPASARTRNRAGSAPDRAGVIDAPKSPASDVRTDVMNGSRMRTALALNVIFHDREATSINTHPSASRCARIGRLMEVLSSHQRVTKYTETPITAAKESAVKSQRLGVRRRPSQERN